ncbi:MAG TPA: NAD(P)/FAD-dependent oxidoreductase [Vicinamibacterales bacterium]
MERCDVLVVGGGPAGSSCARRLHQAGMGVIVLDRSVFPRDKVCAGWITPQVIDDLELDCDDYRRGRTFQPITGFRTGVIGSAKALETVYDRPVSFGIRRCEFDHYLLLRSGADLRLGMVLSSIVRDGTCWIVNDSIKADVVIGAGGHFCPVARWLNPTIDGAPPLVVAQETEFRLEDRDAKAWPTASGVPELYFCRDLSGYGWCFRKAQHLNIGFGLLGRRALPKATAEFVEFLRGQRRAPEEMSGRWHGHAYLVAASPHRQAIDDGVMLLGDAAGLAYPESGEGIRPAIESGLLAASTLVAARGHYSRDRLEPYVRQLRERFGSRRMRQLRPRTMRSAVANRLLPWLLGSRWFTRRLLLERWFLHAHDSAMVNP